MPAATDALLCKNNNVVLSMNCQLQSEIHVSADYRDDSISSHPIASILQRALSVFWKNRCNACLCHVICARWQRFVCNEIAIGSLHCTISLFASPFELGMTWPDSKCSHIGSSVDVCLINGVVSSTCARRNKFF